ncbi:MAG: hypothetical protein PHS80_07555 [Methanothrix sp.]|nr:hypothetical protein [Methanothrix sp.]MDD4448965.1 hypothetical protein [Methanothrix sp.]
MRERSTRFLLDTNVFIAAAKRGWTRTTDLVLRLVDGGVDLIANEALIGEYRKYACELGDYSAGGILISNDRHFDKIKEARIIEVWTISEAIAKML